MRGDVVAEPVRSVLAATGLGDDDDRHTVQAGQQRDLDGDVDNQGLGRAASIQAAIVAIRADRPGEPSGT